VAKPLLIASGFPLLFQGGSILAWAIEEECLIGEGRAWLFVHQLALCPNPLVPGISNLRKPFFLLSNIIFLF
jgi:hypothetical protein